MISCDFYHQVQSVIQPNQQSVIQTATNIQPVAISKGNVILVSKPNSVIQTAQGSIQALQVCDDYKNEYTQEARPHFVLKQQNLCYQVVDDNSDDSYSDDESPKKRRDLLSRRPSYRKILNDLGGGEIAGEFCATPNQLSSISMH